MKTVKTNDSSYFIGKSNLEENGVETYLVFQPMQIYFKRSVGVGTGNLKDCLMKGLNLLRYLIMELLHN